MWVEVRWRRVTIRLSYRIHSTVGPHWRRVTIRWRRVTIRFGPDWRRVTILTGVGAQVLESEFFEAMQSGLRNVVTVSG